MRINLSTLTPKESLLEFDDWVTPSLGEIKDTDKFTEELLAICKAIELVGFHTKNFESIEDTSTTISKSCPIIFN